MELLLYQVDAFAQHPFTGNPAAVCPLHGWLPDETLQAIAAENNLSETAFFVARGDGYELRWFTPVEEVDLCGHATLASAHVVMTELDAGRTEVVFHSRSGDLRVVREETGLAMDLPPLPAAPVSEPSGLAAALGTAVREVFQARDLLAVVDDAAVVRGLRPDVTAIAALDAFGVAVTAPGTGSDADVDFVSRYFAPRQGIPEDPVTGSLHCTLAPLWGERLGKSRLRARQVSARGGDIDCELVDAMVRLRGTAVTVIRGAFILPT